VLRPDDLGEIFRALRAHYRISPGSEITLEANPGTTLKPALREYLKTGVNRLSIGIQSFDDEELKFLSRIHTAGDAYKTYIDAREAGFVNIGIDLIYALPGQTIESWHKNLQKAADLKPEHISAYNLTIVDGTPLGKQVGSGLVRPLPDDDEASFFLHAMEFLREKGYLHYEVSNYAKPGYESKHNRNYWNHAQYIGFGPSAHSYMGNRRFWNVSDVWKYIVALREGTLPREGSEEISPEKLLDEKIMLALRTGCLDIGSLGELAFHRLREKSKSYIDRLIAEKLVVMDHDVMRLTDRGFLFCDEIAGRLSSCV